MPKTQVFLPNKQYTAHNAQALIHGSDKRFRIATMGRKFGKTEMAQREMMDYIGQPESMGWWAAPQYSICDIAWDRLNLALNPRIIKKRSKRDHSMTFVNDSTLKFKSTDNPEGLVGEGIDFLVLEEYSYIKEGVWLEKIRPNLGDADRIGDCMMIGTPNGLGWGYREWVKGQDPKFLDYESWRYDFDVLPIVNEKVETYQGGFPSWTNPYWKDLPTIIHHPRKVVLQEYGARFLDSLGNVFLGIHKIVDETIGFTNKPDPSKKYHVGFDVARSGSGDNSVLTVVDTDYVVQHILMMSGKSLPVQVQTAKILCEEWNDATIMVDTTNPMGDSVFEFIEDKYRNAKGFHYTTAKKKDLIDYLSILIQTGKTTIPNKYNEADELLQELRVFGAERSSSGTIKYEAPEGFKDDYVNSYALGCWSVKEESSGWQPAYIVW